MKPISINSPALLDESHDAQNCCELPDESRDIENCPKFPDAYLSSGILLSVVLLGIYSLTGGVLVIVIAVCVLIVGLGLGMIWKRHFPYHVYSLMNSTPAVDNSNQWTRVKTHWITQGDRRI